MIWRRSVRWGVVMCAAGALMTYPQQSMQAAREGLVLCGETIVPSLFPFFVLSGMVVELGMAQGLGRVLGRFMWPLFRVNGAGAAAWVLGLAGGYPVGARTAVELYQKGVCSRAETERLLAFCNNSGPAFILGVVGVGVFGNGRAGLALYLIHMAASLGVGLVFRFYGEGGRQCAKPSVDNVEAVRFSTAFTSSVRGALSGVLNICAFVVTFGVIIRLLTQLGLVEGAVRALAFAGMDGQQARQLVCGLLEVTCGVTGLVGEGRMGLAALMLGWAGLCVHCQVLCLLADSGLRAGSYFLGKALHGALSALLVMGLGRLFPDVLAVGGWQGRPPQGTMEQGFAQHLSVSFGAAWLIWVGVLFVVYLGQKMKKRGGKGRIIAV